MKVVGLLSGGKDSVYALVQAAALGHEVVAVANLRPVEDSVQELDSHMIQTVGHNAVVGIAQCLNLPLFVRRTAGKAVSGSLHYTASAGDETEDLAMLLEAVKLKFSDLGGVVSGAIRSNYQRLRVEAVCQRLGLQSHAWLWERREERLLHDMCRDGIRAILLKISTIGLKRQHVGCFLHDTVAHLQDLVRISAHFPQTLLCCFTCDGSLAERKIRSKCVRGRRRV